MSLSSMNINSTHSSVSVNIVGLGRMGECHLQAALQLGWRINAVCDKSEKRLQELASRYSLSSEQCYSEAERMFTVSLLPTVCIIATTADTHCAYTCLAAKYKVPFILCEKPMATSLAQCDQMISACEAANSCLAINHQMRFMPQYMLVKQYLQSQRFGELASMNVTGGNFGLAMNGSHYLEAFSFLTASEPASISAWFSNLELANPRGPQFKDRSGQLLLFTESSQRFYLEIGSDQGYGMIVNYATNFGQIYVDELAGELVAVVRKSEYRTRPMTNYGLPSERWTEKFKTMDNVACTKAVLQALVNKLNYPSGHDGRRVVKTLVGAYQSVAQNNKPIGLKHSTLPVNESFAWA